MIDIANDGALVIANTEFDLTNGFTPSADVAEPAALMLAGGGASLVVSESG